jgi:hypothetical protein
MAIFYFVYFDLKKFCLPALPASVIIVVSLTSTFKFLSSALLRLASPE